MLETSLLADQAREAELNKLGDALRVMQQHVDFAALADELGRGAAPSRGHAGCPQLPAELISLN